MKIHPNTLTFEKYMELHNLTKEELCKKCDITMKEFDFFLKTGRLSFLNMTNILNATGLEICDIYYRVPEDSDLRQKSLLK